MGHGMNSYNDKQKRAMRRRNHMARDLADRKYYQRVRESKKAKTRTVKDEDDLD